MEQPFWFTHDVILGQCPLCSGHLAYQQDYNAIQPNRAVCIGDEDRKIPPCGLIFHFRGGKIIQVIQKK